MSTDAQKMDAIELIAKTMSVLSSELANHAKNRDIAAVKDVTKAIERNLAGIQGTVKKLP